MFFVFIQIQSHDLNTVPPEGQVEQYTYRLEDGKTGRCTE